MGRLSVGGMRRAAPARRPWGLAVSLALRGSSLDLSPDLALRVQLRRHVHVHTPVQKGLDEGPAVYVGPDVRPARRQLTLLVAESQYQSSPLSRCPHGDYLRANSSAEV